MAGAEPIEITHRYIPAKLFLALWTWRPSRAAPSARRATFLLRDHAARLGCGPSGEPPGAAGRASQDRQWPTLAADAVQMPSAGRWPLLPMRSGGVITFIPCVGRGAVAKNEIPNLPGENPWRMVHRGRWS